MANEVQVEHDTIMGELDALELEGAAVDNAQQDAAVAAVQDVESWVPGAAMVVDIIDAKFCPNWQLTQREKSDLSGSLAKVLDKYFPGAIAGFDNWHPLLQLGFAGSAIAAQRFDWTRGGFIPMHEHKDDSSDDDREQRGRDPDDSDGGDPLGENGLSFATSSE